MKPLHGRSLRLALALVLVLGPVARGDGPPAPAPRAGSTRALVAALLDAAPGAAKALERKLRARGPKVAPAVRAALAQTSASGKARLTRLLGRLALDYHRAKLPRGMVYVPAGPIEKPRARAPWGPSGGREAVKAFYLDRTEVTVEAWRVWLARLEAAAPGSARRQGIYRPPARVAGNLPITRVRWRDAVRYAKEARGGRLPSAQEFERALRGSSVATYPWGELLRERLTNLADGGPGRVMPVGSYPKGAGPFGALDLVGNVSEWSRTQIAQGRRGRYPLVLGGSFADRADPAFLWRGWSRMRARLGPDEGSPRVGFRVAKDAPELP